VAGTIDTVCFDKTGTLTNLNLKMWGHWQNGIKHVEGDRSGIEFRIMSCCHHLSEINGEVVGDPLEIEMVEYSGYTIMF
jgi:cation-transporting ATPase 13A3/4/5